MRKLAITIAATVFETALQASAPSNWPVTRDTALGFAESFPAAPTIETKVEENGTHLTTYKGGDSSLFCIVIVTDYPGQLDPEQTLITERDSFLTSFHGQLGSTRRVNVNRGSKALTASEFDASNDLGVVRAMIIVEGRRDYMVLGGGRKDGGRQAELAECLDGFTLLTP